MAADTVAVCCKLPNGLHLDVFDQHMVRRRVGTLKGVAIDRSPGAVPALLHHGAAITHVDREGFLAWWKQNEAGDLVKANAVFYQDTAPKAASQAREHDGTDYFAPVTIKDAARSTINGVTNLAEAERTAS